MRLPDGVAWAVRAIAADPNVSPAYRQAMSRHGAAEPVPADKPESAKPFPAQKEPSDE